VESSIVDGSGWIAKRLTHLHNLLDGDASEEDRRAIEEEIAVLSKEQGFACGGPILNRRPPQVPTGGESHEAHPAIEGCETPPVVTPSPQKRSRRSRVVGDAGTWPD
jgi:hypothetical protein